jgi:hypothetical protein
VKMCKHSGELMSVDQLCEEGLMLRSEAIDLTREITRIHIQ